MVRIRPARAGDGPALQEIEKLAGRRFRDIGLGYVADHDPMPLEALAAHAAKGHSWVAVDDDDTPFGYVIVDVVDGAAHVEQVSVTPDRQGQGACRALLEQVRAWALRRGWSGMTLTTFNDVAWNRPLYEHLGFRVLADDDLGPGLQAVRDDEAARGLDPTTRVCMRRDLASPL